MAVKKAGTKTGGTSKPAGSPKAAPKKAAPKKAPKATPKAPKKGTVKKAMAVKLSDAQSRLLSTVQQAKDAGYLGNKAQAKTLDALVQRKLIKRGKKEGGFFRYQLTKAGEKHLATPSTPAPSASPAAPSAPAASSEAGASPSPAPPV
jgi:hypothetical protein